MDVPHTIGLVHAALGIAGLAATVFVVVYGRVTARALRRRPPTAARPLVLAERTALRRWAERDVAFFVLTMVALVAFSLASGARWCGPSALAAGYAVLLTTAGAALAHHFAARCPVCRRRLGFQQSLGLPRACEVCDTPFRTAG